MIKAVFFDIDGTLVSFKTHKLPDSTVRALDLLREKGIKVFIATGRQLQSINNLGTQEFDGYVTLNGGYCLAGKDKVIYKHNIPSEDIEALIRYQENEEAFPCALVEEDGIYQNYVDDSVRQLYDMLDFPHPPLRPLRGNGGKEVYQLIAFFSPGMAKHGHIVASISKSHRLVERDPVMLDDLIDPYRLTAPPRHDIRK